MKAENNAIMKERTACFTGHRDISVYCISKIVNALEKELSKLIKDGYSFFGCGGALGFDTLAALTVIHLKESYPHIKLILVLPHEAQAKCWSTEDQEVYENIKYNADKIVYTAKEYYRGCMHKRNRHLIYHSSACICFLTKDMGGTAYTVGYARKKGCKIKNIADLL